MSWSDESTELLKKLWAEGLSAAQIGRKLGCSRNAVVGKVHRISLQGRPRPESRKPRSMKRKPYTPRTNGRANSKPQTASPKPVVAAPKPPVVPGEQTAVTLMQLNEGHCRWPIGEANGPDTVFCGVSKRRGSSYCEYHAMLSDGTLLQAAE